MNAAAWTAFLATWTRAIAERTTSNLNEKRAVNPVCGLGFPGATEVDLAQTETRLGTLLPRSYREFVKASNGLNQPFSYVPACGGDFWPVAQPDWFTVRNAGWIEAYEGVDDGSAHPEEYSF